MFLLALRWRSNLSCCLWLWWLSFSKASALTAGWWLDSLLSLFYICNREMTLDPPPPPGSDRVRLPGCLQATWTLSQAEQRCLCAGWGSSPVPRGTPLGACRRTGPLSRLCGSATPGRPARVASAPRSEATTSPETPTSTRWAVHNVSCYSPHGHNCLEP